MDHTCHQCGRDIEEGAPFCRNCGAPQIRIPGLEEPASPPMPPGTPGEIQPPAQPVAIAPPAPAPAGGVEWAHALPASAATAGLLTLAFVSPLIAYCLLIASAGMVAVGFYRRRAPNVMITPRVGARIGAIGGLFGFIGFSIITAIGLLLLRGSTKFRQMLQQSMQQAAAGNPDPKAQEVLAWMTSPAGLALMVTIVMVIFLVGFIALSSLGGALGSKLFRGKSE